MSNNYIRAKQQEIVNVAEQMISGKMSLIEGCRRLRMLSFDAEESENKIFSYILGVDAETDELPIGDARKKWTLSKQKEFDTKEKEYLNLESPAIIKSCKAIATYFKRNENQNL